MISTFSPYGSNWSADFDGTNDYLSLADSTPLRIANSDFTVECWVNLTSLPSVGGQYNIIQKGRTTNSNFEYQTFITNISGSYKLAVALSTNGTSNTEYDSSTVSLSTGIWYHVAFVKSSTTLYFFLNGASSGTATLYAAYKYRMENQDTEWYNVQGEDGSTVDIRAIFPAGPYFAVGDILAKMRLGKFESAKVSEAVEAIAGMKMPAGTQASILNSLPELIAGQEKEEGTVLKAIGRVVGDFAGRFIQPGQPFLAYFDLMDRESQLARDPNVITGEDDNVPSFN